MGGKPEVGNTVDHFGRRKTAKDILRQLCHGTWANNQGFASSAGAREQQGQAAS